MMVSNSKDALMSPRASVRARLLRSVNLDLLSAYSHRLVTNYVVISTIATFPYSHFNEYVALALI
jgi:hypothetical protein